jgi:hypothetical protein
MRLGLVERGTYKTTEYDDLTGYQLEVNNFAYNFGEIIEQTRWRVSYLWGFECPPDLIRHRLHFAEEKFFNRMVKNEHYGVFHRHTGAHICLGLVSQEETYNLVIHEVAHEIHYRQGWYNGCDEIVQEAAAIMAEEEFGQRDFNWNPHFTSQQLLHQLKELPGFGRLPFGERWEILTRLRSAPQISYLINRYLDETDGGQFRAWLESRVDSADEARPLLNALASATEQYALFNRRLLLSSLSRLRAWQLPLVTRAINNLKQLDQQYPAESLTNLIQVAFQNLD